MSPSTTTVPAEHQHPSHAHPGAVISYTIPETERVNLSVYTLAGDLVSSLIDERQESGTHSVYFNAENIPAGRYLYILRTGDRYRSDVITVR